MNSIKYDPEESRPTTPTQGMGIGRKERVPAATRTYDLVPAADIEERLLSGRASLLDVLESKPDTPLIRMRAQSDAYKKRQQEQIKSKYTLRLMIDHLDELLSDWQLRQQVFPDFGFNNHMNIQNRTTKGWKLIYQYITNKHQFERVDNYVQARQHLLNDINDMK